MSILQKVQQTGGGKPLYQCSSLLYGAPKIGKSTLASEYPKPLFIDMEGGLGMLPNKVASIEVKEDRKVIGSGKGRYYETVGTAGWQQINEVIMELERGGHEYQTLVFDPVSVAYEFCCTAVAGWMGLKGGIETAEYGKGYKAADEEFRRWMYRAHMLPMGVVFIAHETTADIGTRGDEKRKITAELDKRAWKTINGIVDFIFHCRVEGGQRWIYTRGSEEYTAGSRLAALSTRIPMSYESLAQNYEASTNGGDPERAHDALIERIMKGEQYLIDHKIDGFNVEKRRTNSRKLHAGDADLRQCDFVALESYLQHLITKAKESNGAKS